MGKLYSKAPQIIEPDEDDEPDVEYTGGVRGVKMQLQLDQLKKRIISIKNSQILQNVGNKIGYGIEYGIGKDNYKTLIDSLR